MTFGNERRSAPRFIGDDVLSGTDRKLWNLCYSTLKRFGCLTMFKVKGPDVPRKVDQQIWFFVPSTHPRAEDVRQYLLDELRHEARLVRPKPGEDWFYSTHVRVEFFSGLEGYMTHEECEPMIEAAVENFMRTLAGYRKPKAS